MAHQKQHSNHATTLRPFMVMKMQDHRTLLFRLPCQSGGVTDVRALLVRAPRRGRRGSRAGRSVVVILEGLLAFFMNCAHRVALGFAEGQTKFQAIGFPMDDVRDPSALTAFTTYS
jgi:hypothetical protein